MKRSLPLIVSALVLALIGAAPAAAHFIWLLPRDSVQKAPAVRLIFSQDTQPDQPELLQKIGQTQLFVRGDDGKTKIVRTELGIDADAWQATLPAKGFHEVAGICRYGVVQHLETEPFLLNYYAKTFVGVADWRHPPALFGKAWDKLPLEIVPILPKQDDPQLRVLWQGKPLADAEVVLQVPGRDANVETKTDKEGRFILTAPKKGGPYGIRVGYREKRKGEQDGKKYKEVHHYATLVLAIPAGYKPPPPSDPDATRLLVDARAARALYHNFPGFRADIEIHLDGKTARGQVEVSHKGKATMKLDDAEAAKWAKHTLEQIVGHRLSNGPDEETPCVFADGEIHHPLGRAIRVLNDEFHSSYRIRDRQVIVVNRQVPGSRFTITVMENTLTQEKKFLPVCYVVNTWDAKSDALTSSETHHQTWQRIGAFDLPKETLAVKAAAGKLESRSMKLSKVEMK